MWGQTYGDTGWDEAFALIETSDSGYALAGFTSPSPYGFTDFWLVKTDVHGNMEWSQTYGKSGESFECATSLVEASDGGYALAGLTTPDGEDTDVWLVKTDAYGNVEWNVTYGGEQNDAAYALVETIDGGYAIAGRFNSIFEGIGLLPIYEHSLLFGIGGYGWLIKIDAGGNMEWNQTYGGPDDTSFYSLVTMSDGGYAIAGSYDYHEGWLVKTDSLGNTEWSQNYESDGLKRTFHSLIEASDGGFALAGVCHTPAWNSHDDFWLVKTDSSGNMEWEQAYGGLEHDLAFSVVEASDGGYVIAGIWDFYENNLIGYTEHRGSFWIVKADEYGVMEWNHTYGGLEPDDFDWATSLIATSDGGYAVAGTALHNSTLSRDFWLIKTDEFGVAPVVPEAAWVVLPLLVTTTFAIILSKKKQFRLRS